MAGYMVVMVVAGAHGPFEGARIAVAAVKADPDQDEEREDGRTEDL